jgi:predicted AAA+ superfamily ATPase
MAERIIGRVNEKALLSKLLESKEPELLALYGRRRVGKTFLIRNAYEKHIIFECTGIHQATMQKQLENFLNSIRGLKYSL